jgi:nucleotide-binding universal stress UspA family protein
MFKHLLVPVSRAEAVGRALEVAFALAHPAQSRVTLLHVVERLQDTDQDTEDGTDADTGESTGDDVGDSPVEPFSTFYARLKQQAARDLEDAGERFRRAGVALHTEVLLGTRVGALVQYTQEHDVDLVVLQSHPVDPADPARGWNTISYKVAILAACPVLLVK